MDGPSTPCANRERHTALIVFLQSFLHPAILFPLLMIIAGHNGTEPVNKPDVKQIHYLCLEIC